jgi:hypothetical protein
MSASPRRTSGGDRVLARRDGRDRDHRAVRHARQGVRVCFVDTPNCGTQIELLAPLDESSPS